MDATTQARTHTTPGELGLDTPPVVLTPKAIEMVKDAMQREGLGDHGIRVGVMGEVIPASSGVATLAGATVVASMCSKSPCRGGPRRPLRA